FGLTIPISYASSIIVRSIPLIATESLFIANTQDDSQGAGQTRPVNSGELLVSDNLSKASSKSFLYTKSFHSRILLPIGQPIVSLPNDEPVLQKGVPQSIQRAPCVEASSVVNLCWNGSYPLILSFKDNSSNCFLGYFIKPLNSPILCPPS